MTTIDLTAIEPPDVVEALDFEDIYQELVEDYRGSYPHWTAALESDPVVKLMELAAYREVRFRARVNDAARSVMLAFATGTTLEHLAALFGIRRLAFTPVDLDSNGQGDKPEIREKDDDLRSRTQLAPQGYSVAGPEGAYRSHALNSDGRVLSVSVISPLPCEIVVTILSREGDGTASDELVGIVSKALRADDVRPLSEKVTVRSAEVIRYQIRATLKFFAGPDRSVVLAESKKHTQQYADDMHRLDMEVTTDGLHAAIRVPGVQKVILESPIDGIKVTKQQATFCTGIELIDGGVYDGSA
ncbi:baseplate assembly protein [Paraburkholderia megapolitana]|uniref:Phage-related baseplate assembly protein n=1 Tax=Paraburkholderia megapolitana TaxID=420953 RepID=A0A1I3U816_9BURK|nr:baseplate J/gp47 family protein [Paraburkholderia megapolitana]QDQ83644.1 baseplate assembly protein [Paraburkholderia megapolitana]SFJ78749.1 Phage-related baseplate assembly protein [Paraburkholderia megapolitana]